jgi:hypothetical protein
LKLGQSSPRASAIWSRPIFAELLLEPVTYGCQESGPTGSPERLLAIKLLFLASLRDYDDLAGDSGFTRLLGSPHISEHLFERWWTVRRFEVDEELEDGTIATKLRPYLDHVDRTGNPRVDSWRDELRGAG